MPEMKCLRSAVGMTQMDRILNEDMRRRAGIEMELVHTVYIYEC